MLDSIEIKSDEMLDIEKIKEDLLVKGYIFKKKDGTFIIKHNNSSKYLKCQQYIEDINFKDIRKVFPTLEYVVTTLNNNLKYPPKCPYCNNLVKIQSNKEFSKTCGSNRCKSLSSKECQFQKYGSLFVDSIEFKQKQSQTCLKKYGAPTPLQSKEVLNKIKVTNLNKYGDEYPIRTKEVRNKILDTTINRYGSKCALLNESINKKRMETWNSKYEEGLPQKSECVKQKIKNTNLSHNNGIWNLQTENFKKVSQDYRESHKQEIYSKIKDTNIKKFGCTYPYQNKDIQSKMRKRYFYDKEYFDSSWELYLWIYCKDMGIPIRRNPTSFEYTDIEGNTHKYFPDFEINGKYFEIKGDHLFKNGELLPVYKKGKSKEFCESLAKLKTQCMFSHIEKLILEEDLQECFSYVNSKYGKDYVKSFRI